MSEVSIGFIAKRTGIAVSAIRYYTDIGLVQAHRNAAGHRRFARSSIRRVAFILAAQSFGFTLPRIKELLDTLPHERTPNAADWAQLSQIFKRDLDEQIARLNHLKTTLDGCIGCGCLSLDTCQIYNQNDHRAAAHCHSKLMDHS